MISPGRVKPRESAVAVAAASAPAKSKVFSAPRRGLVLTENLASQQPESALVLDNWVCTTTGVRARGGAKRRYTLDAAVTSMWEFSGPAGKRKFAATATRIYDLTSVADPVAIPAYAVSGRTSGYYSTAHMGTVGGHFLYAVNGSDPALLYDGAAFTAVTAMSTPAITGVATSSLSFVWAYANRLFFVEKGTTRVWYLAVDSIAGAAQKFDLAGIFQKGGELLFGARWSMDSGAGLNAKCVFVSSMGEVAVFEGTDPGNAASWSLSGIYDIGRPIGPKAHVQAGADLLVGVDAGIVPLSQLISKDKAALSQASVTVNIEPLWREEMRVRQAQKIEILKWAEQGWLIASLPGKGALVANIITGAWSTISGWDAQCMTQWGLRAYFGTASGAILEMETGGSDDGANYTARLCGAFDHFGHAGSAKTVTMARAGFKLSSPVAAKVGFVANYATAFPAAPSSPPDYAETGQWDASLWDQAVWDATDADAYSMAWVGVGRSGFVFAPQVQLTYGITPMPRVELVAIEAIFEDGAISI